MKFLLLWSGDVAGMKKAFIEPVENTAGVVGHWSGGKLYLPDPKEVRDALPIRFLKAWDRQCNWHGLPQVWQDERHNDAPLVIRLGYANSRKIMLTIYLQPLTNSTTNKETI
jgi:hypothetical protein